MVSDEVTLVKQRAQALNERLRALLRTMTAVERDDPEFAQEMRHYGIIAEFAEIATSIGDLDTAVAALVERLGFQ
ncbi:MAG TPA: hypothetical protein VFF63_07260 [Candidatus Babeliales bacterium]|nr:hypothetical protein [Candidatus Babeliales bacterium]